MGQPKEEQVEIAERLQRLLLEEFEKRLDPSCDKQATSTDLATLARILKDNGWTIDPADLPDDLRDHITNDVDPEDLDDPDLEVAS